MKNQKLQLFRLMVFAVASFAIFFTISVYYSHRPKIGSNKPILLGQSPETHELLKDVVLDGEEFQCQQSGEKIPKEYFDDDYCDCKDGSDEPHTNACSHIASSRFPCGPQCPSQTVPSSRVNDGICDCCDGSDESNYLQFKSHSNHYFTFLKHIFKEDQKFVRNRLQHCLFLFSNPFHKSSQQ